MADENAFAEGETVGFHGATAIEFVSKIFGGGGVVERASFGRRDAIFLHEILGENFGGFELGGFFVWAPNAQAARLKKINDAEGQRVVGADDGEVGFMFVGEFEERREIFGADRDVLDHRAVLEPFERSTGVAWGAPELGGVGGLGELPDESVFAAAGTEDEDFHEG